MNNRKRARIRILKKECRAKISKMTSFSARAFTIFKYNEKIGRAAIGDDLQDAMWRDFVKLTSFPRSAFKVRWKENKFIDMNNLT